MARWEIKISDPLGEIPDVICADLGTDGYYSRGTIQRKKFSEFSANGTGVLDGPTGGHRYILAITCPLLAEDALRLEAMAEAQDERIDADSATAYLLLTDEVEELIPKLVQTRPLISSRTTAYGRVTGFGTFRVKIDFPDKDHRRHDGRDSQGQLIKLVQFTATEIEVPD